LVDLAEDGERVRHIEDIGFAACPAAVRVEADGPARVNEPPAYGVRFFAVTTGG
jgi:hypothetical protein